MIMTFDAEHARHKIAEAIDPEAQRVAVWVWYGANRVAFRVWLTPSEARQLLGLVAEQKRIEKEGVLG